MRVKTCFLVAVFSTLSAYALAQSVQIEQGAAELAPTPTGPKYDGVVPERDAKNPLPKVPDSKPYLVWTGFQMTAQGSRVFLQTTEAVPFDVKQGRSGKGSKSTLEVLLRGCRIHMANNRRKIDTRFFATPVAFVSARQKGHDVQVSIAVREEVSVSPHGEVGPDGTQFLVVDFPPGKAESDPGALRPKSASAALSEVQQSPSDDEDGTPPLGSAGKRSRSGR